MERLTVDNGFGQKVLKSPVRCMRCEERDYAPTTESGEDIAARIAAFEGIMTNPEILDAELTELLAFRVSGYSPERVSELAQAEREGRLEETVGDCDSCRYKLEGEAWLFYRYPCRECRRGCPDYYAEAALAEKGGGQ